MHCVFVPAASQLTLNSAQESVAAQEQIMHCVVLGL